MTGRRNSAPLGTLALTVALLATMSLFGVAQDGATPGARAPDPLDQILKEAEGPAPTSAGSGDIGAAPGSVAPPVIEPPAPAPDSAVIEASPAAPAEEPVTVGGPEPPVPTDIPVPADPVAKAAFDMLAENCARCHQDGQLVNRLKPAKNFGFVLELDKLAADPHYIVPGNPDGSKIMQLILNKEMPYDVYYEADFSKEPPHETAVAALRAWITALGESKVAACTERKFVSPADMVTAMAADLETVDDTRVADTRYITLTHLYNGCASDADMEVYRQATVKLLNSLSSVSDVVKLETVDEAKTIVRFNLKDVGWQPEDWDRILAVYPYAARPDVQMFDLLSSSTLTPLPYIRGDWFAFTASQPPLYEALLRIPDTFAALQTNLGADVDQGLERFTAKRAGFQESGVSQNNRLIERHTIPTGYFWTSYDFAGDRDRQSLFAFPLGPGDGEFDFQHDGGETIFALPNGFQAYFLSKATGERLAKGPTSIVHDPSQRDQTVTNGISCMGCHDQGIRKAKDEVRAHVTADRTFPKSLRDAVEALYPTVEEMDRILETDAERFHGAMAAAGLDPALKSNGVEMINALAKRYESDVELSLAAAEFGQTNDEFIESLGGAGAGEATRLGRRLEQGLVPRDAFEAQFGGLLERVSDLERIDLSRLAAGPTDVAKADRPVADARAFDLSLTSDRSSYAVNDLPVFTVTSERDCFLTLVNVDGKGLATVIYPNKLQTQNLIKAGQDFKFPADDAPFQFRFADPGTETVIGLCSLEDRPVDNIALDATRDFTELGQYEQFLSRQITVEPKVAKKETPNDIVVRAAIKMAVN